MMYNILLLYSMYHRVCLVTMFWCVFRVSLKMVALPAKVNTIGRTEGLSYTYMYIEA